MWPSPTLALKVTGGVFATGWVCGKRRTRRWGCTGDLSACRCTSLPSGGLGVASPRPGGATLIGCHREVVGIAALVASSGVLMLRGADQSQTRQFEHRTRRRRRRPWRACCALARTPAVEGLTVHITAASTSST